MMSISKTINFYFKMTLIFLFIVNIKAQSLNTESSNKYNKNFEDARLIFHRVYFEKASLLFDDLIKENPKHALTYAYAAMIDYMLFKDPTNNINKARELNIKSNSEYQFTLALCYFASDNLNNCESSIKEYLSKNPNDQYGLHVLGFTQIDLGRPDDGLKTLSNLINLNPEYFPAYNHIGYAHLKLNQKNEALNAFSQFLKSDSLNPSALDSYAEGLENLELYDEAIANLTRAILLEPNFAYGWGHMGDIFMHLVEPELAIDAYEKAKMSAKYYGTSFITSINEKISSIK